MTTCPRCNLKWGRSDAEHNTLFGVIDMAFDSWPEAHDYQPPDAEELRGWLACRVGHYVIIRLNGVRGLNKDTARDLLKAFTENAVYFETDDDRQGTFVIKPRTMKKALLLVREFRAMAEKVYTLIEAVTGITPETYKQHMEHKHGLPRGTQARQLSRPHAESAQELGSLQATAGNERGASGADPSTSLLCVRHGGR